MKEALPPSIEIDGESWSWEPVIGLIIAATVIIVTVTIGGAYFLDQCASADDFMQGLHENCTACKTNPGVNRSACEVCNQTIILLNNIESNQK